MMITLTINGAYTFTEDDLFEFELESGCFSGESFELGGAQAKYLHLIIDNNDHRIARGELAGARIRVEIDGSFLGEFNAELPKHRHGTIEIHAYDDMLRFDTEFPSDHPFPQTFRAVYSQCMECAGYPRDSFVLDPRVQLSIISHDYVENIYANSCRNLISGMAEWGGGFAYINDAGNLQVDVFEKEVTKHFDSSELLDFEYSDETVAFSKIVTSQKNKTYSLGNDNGYTMVINNQYISHGLEDSHFEILLHGIYDYYAGFTLTPMTLTLAEPDLDLKLGQRIEVYDEEEDVTLEGNISKIVIRGNCLMEVTCGGYNVNSRNNYNPTSRSSLGQNGGSDTAKQLITEKDAVLITRDSGPGGMKGAAQLKVPLLGNLGGLSFGIDDSGNVKFIAAQDGYGEFINAEFRNMFYPMKTGYSGIFFTSPSINGSALQEAYGGGRLELSIGALKLKLFHSVTASGTKTYTTEINGWKFQEDASGATITSPSGRTFTF